MSDADYYPAGAYNDPNAPYNEVEVPEKDFEVTISQTLSRTVIITTNDYNPEYDEEDGNIYANTENTDWKKAYEDCDFKIQELLAELKNYIQRDMAITGSNTGTGRYLKKLLEACDNWVEDDYEICEN